MKNYDQNASYTDPFTLSIKNDSDMSTNELVNLLTMHTHSFDARSNSYYYFFFLFKSPHTQFITDWIVENMIIDTHLTRKGQCH